MTTILLIEDQEELCRILKDTLGVYGFDVHYSLNGRAGAALYSSLKPDIVIADIMMPEADGFAAISMIRQQNAEVPILMLTAKPLTEDLVRAFELGCNDYIRKPFVMEELIARLKAFAKGTRAAPRMQDDNIYRMGNFLLNTVSQELSSSSQVFRLSYKEVQILKRLWGSRSHIVNRKELLEELWGNDHIFNSRTMNVYMNRIRNYFQKDPCVEIITIRGIGYKMVIRDMPQL